MVEKLKTATKRHGTSTEISAQLNHLETNKPRKEKRRRRRREDDWYVQYFDDQSMP